VRSSCHVFALFSCDIFEGKPVAVTHSRGKGPSRKVDSSVEEQYWKSRRGEQDDPSTGKQQDGGEREGGMSVQSVAPPAHSGDVLNSMAEIASCSYEARKVGACDSYSNSSQHQLLYVIFI